MKSPHIAVIGAGAFGGWTALHLLERGARVTLLDAWGPGNSRSSSGGETRIMRAIYGPNQPYTELAARALKLWQQYEQRWKRQFLHPTGVLWMVSGNDDSFERGSIEMLRASDVAFRELSRAELQQRWPQINFEGIQWGIYEPQSGYLDARASCQAVVDAFIAAGGNYQQAEVKASHALDTGKDFSISLTDGSPLEADTYVFACGPWLGKLFPEVLSKIIRPTKQDVFFFGTPAGDERFGDLQLPVWADHYGRFRYGIPSSDRRGFKIADDTRGPIFDPTDGDRIVSPEILADLRDYLAFRFPALENAPLIETRVCQYEQTPDSDFIVDRHPAFENVWLLGGGSGHGFKHGPALGEFVANTILNNAETKPEWKLSRFSEQDWQATP